MTNRIWVVVTAKNEAESIGWLLDRLPFRAIVVDAASSDGTAEIAEAHGAVTASFPCSIGLGLRTGWAMALERGADYVLQIDAGGSMLPGEHSRFRPGTADIVIGNRFAGRYVGRKWRRLASRVFSAVASLVHGYRIHDWTVGYRLYSREALEIALSFLYKDERYTFNAEALLRLLRCGFSVSEVPITYYAGRSGFSLSDCRAALQFLTLKD